MERMKKLLSIFLAALMITSIVPITNIEVNAATQVEQILAYAADIAANNPHAYDGYCLAFVGDCYKSAGYSHYSMGDAYTAGTAWIISTSSTDIPVGALVFYDYSWNASYGHVGIYAGNGMMYDAESGYGGVKLRTFKTNGYRGWGWYGGIQPSGTTGGSSPTTCSCSTSYAGEYTTSTGNVNLNIRSGHGTSYSVIGSIPDGTTVNISKANGTASGCWGHVTYNGVIGYVAMQYLVAKPATYTISYNANGGIGAPSIQTKTHGTTLTLSTTKPAREGYTFLGWSTNSTATSATYSAGGSFTTNANTTLYAVWKANTYTVSYNANGGTGAPASQTKTHGTALTLSTTKPTRTGYTFLGWSTSSTATSATYSPGGSFTIDANTTLYAVWKQNAVELTANSSNNAVISNAGGSKYFTYTPTTSGTYVIYSTSDADTRVYLYDSSGSQLASDDDSGDDFNFRLQYNMIAGTTYRFEIKYYNSSKTGTIPFEFGQVFSISYNANGGAGVPSLQNKDYGKALTLSTTKPTRTGYTFLGWSTSSTATSATYSAGSSFTTNANTTLYAVWKANTYTVSYNGNGGTGVPASQTKTHGTALTLSTTKPTRAGYTFLGWSTCSTATSATYSAGSSFTTNANTTLYAVWKVNTYTVSYNANGGKGAPSSQTKTYDEYLALSYDQPIRDGYWFVGWATSSSATNVAYYPGDEYTLNKNITLYAVWLKAGIDINYDGVIDSKDTGLYKEDNTWYYVKNGDIDYSYTGLVKHTNGVWHYIVNGVLDTNYIGLVKHSNGIWYYVENGILDSSHTGLVKHINGIWYYVQKGQLNWNKTGLVKHTNGIWYYVQKGQLNWNYTGLVKHTNGIWYYVQKGQLNWNKTGLVKHTDGAWYYVQKGQINWNYTGLVKHTNGKWYYVQKGKLNWKYTGYTYYNGKKYKVVNGVKV